MKVLDWTKFDVSGEEVEKHNLTPRERIGITVYLACTIEEAEQLTKMVERMRAKKADDDPFAFDSDEGLSEWQGESENEMEAVFVQRAKFETLRRGGKYKNVLLFETEQFLKGSRGQQAMLMADLVGVVRSSGFIEIIKDRYGLAVPDDVVKKDRVYVATREGFGVGDEVEVYRSKFNRTDVCKIIGIVREPDDSVPFKVKFGSGDMQWCSREQLNRPDLAPPLPAPKFEKGERVYVQGSGSGIIRQCSSIRSGQFTYRVDLGSGQFDLSVPEEDMMTLSEWKQRTSPTRKRPALKRRA